MSVPSSRARHGLQALLLSVVLVPLCSAACIEEACRFTGGKQISPVMVGVFVVALVALVLATQSSFAAYLGKETFRFVMYLRVVLQLMYLQIFSQCHLFLARKMYLLHSFPFL